jgi:hypothetical protein
MQSPTSSSYTTSPSASRIRPSSTQMRKPRFNYPADACLLARQQIGGIHHLVTGSSVEVELPDPGRARTTTISQASKDLAETDLVWESLAALSPVSGGPRRSPVEAPALSEVPPTEPRALRDLGYASNMRGMLGSRLSRALTANERECLEAIEAAAANAAGATGLLDAFARSPRGRSAHERDLKLSVREGRRMSAAVFERLGVTLFTALKPDDLPALAHGVDDLISATHDVAELFGVYGIHHPRPQPNGSPGCCTAPPRRSSTARVSRRRPVSWRLVRSPSGGSSTTATWRRGKHSPSRSASNLGRRSYWRGEA